MKEKKTPSFSELIPTRKERNFTQLYFFDLAHRLENDGHHPKAIEDGLVNAAFAYAHKRGDSDNFLKWLQTGVIDAHDQIADILLEETKQRRKRSN